jgi:hypothetical protein
MSRYIFSENFKFSLFFLKQNDKLIKKNFLWGKFCLRKFSARINGYFFNGFHIVCFNCQQKKNERLLFMTQGKVDQLRRLIFFEINIQSEFVYRFHWGVQIFGEF